MIDTNVINQAGESLQTATAQFHANWPAICAVAMWLRSEVHKVDAWLMDKLSFIIAHGGAVRLASKLVWNPEPGTPNPEPRTPNPELRPPNPEPRTQTNA